MNGNNNVVQELYKIIEERKGNPIEGSYTSYLFEEGLDKILKKIGEESAEVIISSKNNDSKEIVSEISDLFYHTLVLMVSKGIKLEDITSELETRRMKICNKKQKREDIVGIH
jgi:phosphoribosyl-ATP pyrophosphohydrolase